MSPQQFRQRILAAALCFAACNAARSEVTGIDTARLDAFEPLIAEAIERGDLPGCVVAIGRAEGVVFFQAYGHRALEPTPEPMTTDTVFDLASLTKPIATATCIMRLVDQGRLRLREKVDDVLPGFGANGKEDVTVEQLLVHSAGFIPDNPVGDYEHGKQVAWRRIDALAPLTPPGSTFRYTDVGFLTLGRIVEKLHGKPLDEVAKEEVFGPLGMAETGFKPPTDLAPRIAPTEKIDGEWRRGQVHDPRSYMLGGVAGHAGLFSSAADLSRYARMMLAGGALDGARVLSPAGVRQMTRAREISGQKRALGWDAQSGYSSNRGELMTDRAFGHGGFTGTGIWIDPGLDLFVVFLSSRLHPDGKGSVNDLIGRIGTVAAAAVRPVTPEVDAR